MSITNAELAQKLNELIAKDLAIREELEAWISGAADGGPNSDGLFPLTDYHGTERLTKSPARLEADVSGLVDSASTFATAAGLHASAAEDAADAAALSEAQADNFATNAATSAGNAAASASAAATSEANALAFRNTASASKNAAVASEANAATSETNAAASEVAAAQSAAEAAASAAAAALFDPDTYYSKVAADARFVQIGNSAIVLALAATAGGVHARGGVTSHGSTAPMTFIDWQGTYGRLGSYDWGTATFQPLTVSATEITLDASLIETAGVLDFDEVVGDKIMLYAAAGLPDSYGLGIEGGTLYFKTGDVYRWYRTTNADNGASDIMELHAGGLSLAGYVTADHFIGTGLYNDAQTRYVWDAEYGGFAFGTYYVGGTGRGGYNGLAIADGSAEPTFMSNGAYYGIYAQGASVQKWLVYKDPAYDALVTSHASILVGGGARAALLHAGGYTSGNVYVSSSGPSGGADGDIWFQLV